MSTFTARAQNSNPTIAGTTATQQHIVATTSLPESRWNEFMGNFLNTVLNAEQAPEFLSSLKNYLHSNPDAWETRWFMAWSAVKLAPYCSFGVRKRLLTRAWREAQEVRRVAPHSALAPAMEALLLMAYKEQTAAVKTLDEMSKKDLDHHFIYLVTRAEVEGLWRELLDVPDVLVQQHRKAAQEQWTVLLRASLPTAWNRATLLELARLESQQRDNQLALQHYRTYVQLESKNPYAFAELSELLLLLKDCTTAVEYATKALALSKNPHFEALIDKGKFCLELNEPMRGVASKHGP